MDTIIQVPWRRLRARDLNPALVVAIKKELQLARLDCLVVVHTDNDFAPVFSGSPACKKNKKFRGYKMVVYTASTRQIDVGDKWLLRAIAAHDGADQCGGSTFGRKVKNTQTIMKNVPLTLQEVMQVAYWRQQLQQQYQGQQQSTEQEGQLEGQCPTSP